MQQERQWRRRHKSTTHVTRGRVKIRSPALPFSNWEPPPYQPRDSPTDDADAVRRPSHVVGDHTVQTANHFDSGTVDPADTGKPAVSHSHRHRVSIVDATGVVVHRSLETRDASGRRQPRGEDACKTTRKAVPPAVPRHRDRPPRRPPRHFEPPPTNAPTPPPPFSAVAQHDSVAVPIICNYVDPAPMRHDEHPPSSTAVEVDSHHHQQKTQLLAPPSTADAPGTPNTAPSSSGVEIGVAVESEVREVKRMLRSFMAKLRERSTRGEENIEIIHGEAQ